MQEYFQIYSNRIIKHTAGDGKLYIIHRVEIRHIVPDVCLIYNLNGLIENINHTKATISYRGTYIDNAMNSTKLLNRMSTYEVMRMYCYINKNQFKVEMPE